MITDQGHLSRDVTSDDEYQSSGNDVRHSSERLSLHQRCEMHHLLVSSNQAEEGQWEDPVKGSNEGGF